MIVKISRNFEVIYYYASKLLKQNVIQRTHSHLVSVAVYCYQFQEKGAKAGREERGNVPLFSLLSFITTSYFLALMKQLCVLPETHVITNFDRVHFIFLLLKDHIVSLYSRTTSCTAREPRARTFFGTTHFVFLLFNKYIFSLH